ncbi:hypothetical protein FRB95_010896 [Tulasnella sp. JGI-2019a]|nr:hypothetical protein FRB93_001156 [Tulasnella sp. JGI-2019a]KAG9035658.1 hypothetical protein FRB95_010896 [Tulasnella sp. JGI-2019a]
MQPYSIISQNAMTMYQNKCYIPQNIQGLLVDVAEEMAQELEHAETPKHGTVDCGAIKQQYRDLQQLDKEAEKGVNGHGDHENTQINRMLRAVTKHMQAAGCPV